MKEKFEIAIEHADDAGFSGRCVDTESPSGHYVTTQINGFVEGGFISFTKSYSHSYVINDNNKIEIDKNKKGHTVNYEGVFNASMNSFEGTWEIHFHFKRLWIQWATKTFKGTWMMHREL